MKASSLSDVSGKGLLTFNSNPLIVIRAYAVAAPAVLAFPECDSFIPEDLAYNK